MSTEHQQSRIAQAPSNEATAETTLSIMQSSATDFQRDLGRYWRYVRRVGGIALTQEGRIYKSQFKMLAAAMNAAEAPADERDSGRLWFMRRLLQAMRELNEAEQGRFIVANPSSQLLGMPMAQRVKWTFETWRDDAAWNELLRLPLQVSGGYAGREGAAALSRARLTLLRAIGRLTQINRQSGGWVALADLIAHIKRNDYAFLFERRHRGSVIPYASPYQGTNNPYGLTFEAVKHEANGWDLVEGGFIVNVLTEPLWWMGLVELGYARDVQAAGVENTPPTAFRLTPSGAWLIGGGDPPTFVESGGKLIVQPNFTVLALEPISDAVLSDLDHFAEPQGGDRVIAYHLTRESLYRGQQSGWTAARVIAFLEVHQGGPVPANVRRSLEEWEVAHRRITFYRNACVVQFADAEAEQALSDVLAPFAPRAIGPRFKLVEGRNAKEVAAALREAGWTPVLQPAGDQATEGVLRTDDEGTVTFTQAAASVYALGKLARFAALPAADEAGRAAAHITDASVRAAMSAGMTLDELLATLAELHSGPLPVALEQKIRAWASFFGNAAFHQVTLLELSSQTVLANLLDDREVGPYLKPIEGSVRPLALVLPAHAEVVRAMLRERGINVA
ncbi:MAG: helicase-associated domain-containing protein [Thermoflexales bacterium]|nr:helicase-associated domain-containing protein [Thermoflexales bacterium]MDW8350541.1 helicase-associated domain-containing protein [Anaerolineae bacterium]